ncbi:MAG: tetratricopeptide repeat protein, partial [Candidatus Wallbacteria bacterium]|nr:tetratricopeptide repeat protein [Candidatus Wallbacteria bacterium]
MRALWVCPLLFILLSGLTTPGELKRARGLFQEGLDRLKKGRALESAAFLEESLIIDDRAEGRFYLGQALAVAGQTDRAVDELRKASEMSPAWTEPLLVSSGILLEAGRTGEAVAEMETLSARFPERAEFLHRLGSLHQAAGDDQKALAAYYRIMELVPEDVPALRQILDLTSVEGGDLSLAEKAATRILSLDPLDKAASEFLSRMKPPVRANDFQVFTGEAQVSEVFRTNAHYWIWLLLLVLLVAALFKSRRSIVLYFLKYFGEYSAYVRFTGKVVADEVAVRDRLGQEYLKKKNYYRLSELFQHQISSGSPSREGLEKLATYSTACSRTDWACDAYTRLNEIFGDREALFLLAQCRLRIRKYKEAAEAFSRIMAAGKDDDGRVLRLLEEFTALAGGDMEFGFMIGGQYERSGN